MTHTKDEALKLALEALEREEYRLRQTGQSQVYSGIGFAITAIKQALAAQPAPVQEPVARVSLQWLAEMILSDCGHSSNYTPLLDRVKARIEQWERANSAPTPPAQPAVPEGWRVELADAVYGDVRLIAPNGEAWRFRNTDGADEFAWRFLVAMLTTKPEKGQP
jgi:hypothetical protein